MMYGTYGAFGASVARDFQPPTPAPALHSPPDSAADAAAKAELVARLQAIQANIESRRRITRNLAIGAVVLTVLWRMS